MMTEENFISLFDQCKSKLFGLALRMLKNEHDAKDAVQALIEKMWNRRTSLHRASNKDVFLMVAMKNYCLDQLKSGANRNVQNLDVNREKVNNRFNRQYEFKERLDLVKKALKEMPEQQALLIQLRDISQYDYSEIEQITGLRQGAIRTALSRARKELRLKIQKYYNYGLAKNQTAQR